MPCARDQPFARNAGALSASMRRLVPPILLATLALASGVVAADHCTPSSTGHKLVFSSPTKAPAPLYFVLTTQSRLQLKGTATIGDWSCKSKQASGKLILPTDRTALATLFDRIQATRSHDPPPLRLPLRKPVIGELSIPVTSLGGNSSGIDHDIWHAMKATQHPNIRYSFTRVCDASLFWSKTSPSPCLKLQVLGKLTLAGVTRRLRTDMYVRKLAAGRYSIHATSTVLMRNFGVTPPSIFFGLIRGHNRVRVIFDLYLTECSVSWKKRGSSAWK